MRPLILSLCCVALIISSCQKPAKIVGPKDGSNLEGNEVFAYDEFKSLPANPDFVEWFKHETREALKQKDPRNEVRQICYRAMAAGPNAGLECIRLAQEQLGGRDLPPDRQDFFGELAALAAPHDTRLRDSLLVHAIEDANRALADGKLWKTTPPPPGAFGYGDPQQALNAQKSLLSLKLRLWHILLGSSGDQKKAIEMLRDLLVSPEAQVEFPPCVIRTCGYDLREYAAGIEPALLLYAWPEPDKDGRANFCYQAADRRHTQGLRDRFKQLLIRHGTPLGSDPVRRRFQLLKCYDADAALETLPSGELARSSLAGLLRILARTNPERAMKLAESERDADLSESCKVDVALATAHFHPEKADWAVHAAGKEADAIRAQSAVAFAERGEIDKARRCLDQISNPRDRAIARLHVAIAATKLSKKDRIAEAKQAVEQALRVDPNALIHGPLVLIYLLNRSTGSYALKRILETVPARQYQQLVFSLWLAPAADMLLLYQAAKGHGVDILRKHPQCLLQLAKASPETALKSISELPAKDRLEAQSWAVRGIAAHDLTRAQQLADSMPKDGRRPSFDELACYHLAAHPDKLNELRDKMDMQFIAQAAQMALLEADSGEGFFQIMRGLDDRAAKSVADRISGQGNHKEFSILIHEKLKDHINESPAIGRLAVKCRISAETKRYSWDWRLRDD